MGRLTDSKGRKAGTLAFAAFYTIGALTTRSPLLWVLLLGRLAGGIGTSLLFSAPEAWLVGEAQRTGASGNPNPNPSPNPNPNPRRSVPARLATLTVAPALNPTPTPTLTLTLALTLTP